MENFQIENTFSTKTENFCHIYVRRQTTNQLLQINSLGDSSEQEVNTFSLQELQKEETQLKEKTERSL